MVRSSIDGRPPPSTRAEAPAHLCPDFTWVGVDSPGLVRTWSSAWETPVRGTGHCAGGRRCPRHGGCDVVSEDAESADLRTAAGAGGRNRARTTGHRRVVDVSADCRAVRAARGQQGAVGDPGDGGGVALPVRRDSSSRLVAACAAADRPAGDGRRVGGAGVGCSRYAHRRCRALRCRGQPHRSCSRVECGDRRRCRTGPSRSGSAIAVPGIGVQ